MNNSTSASPWAAEANHRLRALLATGRTAGSLQLEDVRVAVGVEVLSDEALAAVRILLREQGIVLIEPSTRPSVAPASPAPIRAGGADDLGEVDDPLDEIDAIEVDILFDPVAVAQAAADEDDEDVIEQVQLTASRPRRVPARPTTALRLAPGGGGAGGSSDPVRMYLKEIGQVALLTGDEEVQLARRIQDGLAAEQRLADEAMGIAEAAMAADAAAQGIDLPPAPVAPVAPVKAKAEPVVDGAEPTIGEGTDEAAAPVPLQPLTPSERRKLQRLVKDGQIAEQELTRANLRLVVSIAKRYVGRGMQLLDLIQEGNLGLMRAVEKFDHTKGFKFSTYATWWIRQAITRAIADQARTIRIPVHMVESMHKVHRIQRQMLQELEREPTIEELAIRVDMTPERVRDILRISQDPLSLDSPVGEEDDSSLADFIADGGAEAPAEAAAKMLLGEAVIEALAGLSDREKQVVRLRFGLEDGQARTLEEVGREFGVTRERIRQIESKTLAKLRHPLRSQKLRDYLDGA